MMEGKVRIGGEDLLLLPERAAYFSNKKILLISDLHLGKINHFRKAGIAVPTAANNANTETLVKLIMDWKPKRVIFIGDLFHSSYNTEWEVLGQIIKNFSSCSFELVPGNHDIMSETQYNKHKLVLHELKFELSKKIVLVHEPEPHPEKNIYYLSGHIHPAISLSGKGRQSVTLPCFWFGESQGFLPAFGVFTGFKRIRPNGVDQVFAIVNSKVTPISLTPT